MSHKYHKPGKQQKMNFVKGMYDFHLLYKKMNKDCERILFHHII